MPKCQGSKMLTKNSPFASLIIALCTLPEIISENALSTEGPTFSSDFMPNSPDVYNNEDVISFISENTTVEVGASVNFSCESKIQESEIKWYNLNPTKIDEVNDITQEQGEKLIESTPSNQLVLDYVNYTDEGWYTCIVRHLAGRKIAGVYLTVLDKTPESTSSWVWMVSAIATFIFIGLVIMIVRSRMCQNGLKRPTRSKNQNIELRKN